MLINPFKIPSNDTYSIYLFDLDKNKIITEVLKSEEFIACFNYDSVLNNLLVGCRPNRFEIYELNFKLNLKRKPIEV